MFKLIYFFVLPTLLHSCVANLENTKTVKSTSQDRLATCTLTINQVGLHPHAL